MGPPLNPNQEIIDGFTSLVPITGQILLLGVTPKLYAAYTNVTAVDYNQSMIDRVWPGNTETKQAHLDNWLTVNFERNTFDGVVGDGSVNMLSYPTDVRHLFERCMRWIKPNGVFATRMFTRPDEPVTEEYIRQQAGKLKFDAWRRLFNMMLAERHGSIFPAKLIIELFDQMYPDRSVLPYEDVSAVDAYRTSTSTSWFPTRAEILDIAPPGSRFVNVGSYELADTCPILTFIA
jgi:SAM-dependent methyltransferase